MGGVLSGKMGALKCTEPGVPENADQSLEPEGASGNVPDTLCPGAQVMSLASVLKVEPSATGTWL